MPLLIIPLLMMNKNTPSENMNLDEKRKLKILLLEALNQINFMVLLNLKELYSDWTSNDNEGLFSDFLKAKLQDLQEKTIK